MSYLCDLSFDFHLHSIMISRMNTGTLVLLLVFQNVLLFKDDTLDGECE